jgi:hypothetical protein
MRLAGSSQDLWSRDTITDRRDSDVDHPAAQPAWTHRLLADAVGDLGNSASQVGRILAQADPEFFTRTAQVCSVYRHHRPRRREFEYGRHGPVSIIAALGVHA